MSHNQQSKAVLQVRGSANRPTTCADRKLPVVLMSRVLRHSVDEKSVAWVQPTTPAKQQRIVIFPSSLTVMSTADCSSSAFVISILTGSILEDGKSFFKASISVVACDGARSNRARPDKPCSRRARALTRARVPAPPVTMDVVDTA